MSRLGIVTAMETEIWPLVRRWQASTVEHRGRRYRFYESGNAVAVAGGIGHEAGMRAAEALLERAKSDVLVAAGLAGGLRPQWTLGRTLMPRIILDEGTGERFTADRGNGSIVSSRQVAGAAIKRDLARRFDADLVDMEGAAVAEAARAHGAGLLVVKAVSDELQFEFPPLQPYVAEDGRFQGARFALHACLHPGWWAAIARLKRNSGIAARALSELLRQVIVQEVGDREATEMRTG